MNHHTPQDWNNYWQGRSAEKTGDALIGVGIEHNDVLEKFWTNIFSLSPKSAKVVDLACGAGSVLKHAHNLGFSDLTGVDIAKDAISVMQSKFPTAAGVVSPLNKMPFPDAQFDLIVSQFGFEYAGTPQKVLETTSEAARILSKKGKIVLVTHIKDGAIEHGCLNSLRQIEVVRKSGFLEKSKETFQTLYTLLHAPARPPQDHFNTAIARVSPSADPIMKLLRSAKNQQNDFTRFVYFMMESSHKLMTNFERYTLEDCLSWLNSMTSEINAYQGRMDSMTQSALSEDTLQEIVEKFNGLGLQVAPPQTLHLIEGDAPAAWVLTVRQ